MAPIHNASAKGNIDDVRRLVNAGASVSARNNHGMTPLMIAASKGHANVIRYLLSKRANARVRQNQNNPRTALIYAVEKGNVNSVRALIRHSNLNVQDGNGRSALTVAAELNNPEILHMLVRAGARPNNMTNEYLFANNAMRNRLGGALVRHTIAKSRIIKNLRAARTRRRNLAMRQQLAGVKIQEGNRTVTGLPVGVRNLIGKMMRK